MNIGSDLLCWEMIDSASAVNSSVLYCPGSLSIWKIYFVSFVYCSNFDVKARTPLYIDGETPGVSALGCISGTGLEIKMGWGYVVGRARGSRLRF